MKINSKYIVFLSFIASIVVRCKEKNHILPDQIEIGESLNMQICSIDSVLAGGYYNAKSYEIDLDNNGTLDYRLNSYVYGSPAVGGIPGSSFQCLHSSAQFFALYISDTLFLNIDTVIYQTDKTEIIYQHNYSCKRTEPADSIVSIHSGFKLSPRYFADILVNSDTYISDTSKLSSESYFYPGELLYASQDTMIYRKQKRFNNCSSFPQQDTVYIGLRCNERLGWLKIFIEKGYVIHIVEHAIQK